MGKLIRLLIVALGASVVYEFLVRPWHLRWGASDDDIHRSLPGDDLVANPVLGYTRAVTIQAPPVKIWPWLVQIGYRRAGWYSYDGLEALVGAADFVDGQQSANRIVPELQNLREGAIIRLAPEPGPFFEVALVEPENTLVLHALVDGPSDGRPAGTHYANVSWAFVLDGQPDGSTRLIVRQRLDYFPRPENTLLWRVITEPLNFVMERKMLLGIRLRSEIAANLDPAAAPAD